MREFGNKLHMLIQCFRRIKLTKPLFEDQDIDKSIVYANYCTTIKIYHSISNFQQIINRYDFKNKLLIKINDIFSIKFTPYYKSICIKFIFKNEHKLSLKLANYK